MNASETTPWPIDDELRTLGLSWPEVVEDFPWGDRVLKVRGKIFCFLSTTDEGLRMTVKLPLSSAFATSQPWGKPWDTSQNRGHSRCERPAIEMAG
jgi:hypothetical protein